MLHQNEDQKFTQQTTHDSAVSSLFMKFRRKEKMLIQRQNLMLKLF